MDFGHYKASVQRVKGPGIWIPLDKCFAREFGAASSTSAAELVVRMYYDQTDQCSAGTYDVRVERWDGCVVEHLVEFEWAPKVRVHCGTLVAPGTERERIEWAIGERRGDADGITLEDK